MLPTSSDPGQATPGMPAAEMARLIGQAPPEHWPAGWAHWENVHEAHRRLAGRFLETLPPYPGGVAGRGVVIAGGGATYFRCAWVCVRLLRRLGCTLPVQLWHLGEAELDASMRRLVAPLGVECVDALAVARDHPCRVLRGWELKPYMVKHCPFREVLLLDADNVPLRDPTSLFDAPEYRRHGAVLWPDFHHPGSPDVRHYHGPHVWAAFGVPGYRDEPPAETAQVVVDKARCWRELGLALWYAEHSDWSFQQAWGDTGSGQLPLRVAAVRHGARAARYGARVGGADDRPARLRGAAAVPAPLRRQVAARAGRRPRPGVGARG